MLLFKPTDRWVFFSLGRSNASLSFPGSFLWMGETSSSSLKLHRKCKICCKDMEWRGAFWWAFWILWRRSHVLDAVVLDERRASRAEESDSIPHSRFPSYNASKLACSCKWVSLYHRGSFSPYSGREGSNLLSKFEINLKLRSTSHFGPSSWTPAPQRLFRRRTAKNMAVYWAEQSVA